ncbi:protein [Bifidobacterium longum subsp. longum CECT 7347]|nr:protein [Bifidobacterium longum subsp. longum CECT 7347]
MSHHILPLHEWKTQQLRQIMSKVVVNALERIDGYQIDIS